MYSLIDSSMFPDPGSNPQPWCMGTTLESIELPSQGQKRDFPLNKHACDF